MRNEAAAIIVRRLRKEHPTNLVPDRHVPLFHRPEERRPIVMHGPVMDGRVAGGDNVDHDKPGQWIAATSHRAGVDVASTSLMVGAWVMVTVEDDIGLMAGEQLI